ncbi:methyltransferase domain-containing protein [Magnetococcus sp. PR-3]|uniref:methyltransferase domain-containing protein n=1 Tax=Magnetococcus sp. PR-3 TaxID=3120355 RepID=UPI002FCE4368
MMTSHEPGLGERLRQLTELVDRGAQQAYDQKGLPYRPRYTPIMRALGDGICTVKEITARLSVTQGAISQTIKQMEQDGLIRRTPGQDARQQILSLTETGAHLQTLLYQHWQATFTAIEHLEREIGTPLRLHLGHAIDALSQQGFAARITEAENHHQLFSPTMPEDATSHFQQGGKAYASHRPNYPKSLAHALADLTPDKQLAVDVGCGNGQLTKRLSPLFTEVVGTDVSKTQLQQASKAQNLTYRLEQAEELSMADNSVDLLVAAQAAHWFDLPRFYQMVKRVLKPGGVIALVSYGVPTLAGVVNAPFQKFYWQDLHTFWPPERLHVEQGYMTLPFPFDPLAFPKQQLEKDWDLPALMGYVGTWSALKRAHKHGYPHLQAHLEDALKPVWGAIHNKHTITWPITVRAGRLT